MHEARENPSLRLGGTSASFQAAGLALRLCRSLPERSKQKPSGPESVSCKEMDLKKSQEIPRNVKSKSSLFLNRKAFNCVDY